MDMPYSYFTYPIINAKLNSMKRKTLLLLTISVTMAATVLAQSHSITGGISAGANYSMLKSGDESTSGNYDWKWKWGPVGGIWVNFPVGNTVSIQPSLLYSQMGGRYYFTD